MKISRIRWYTLTYARGTLGIGFIRFKHGRIRWHTLAYGEAELCFKHALKMCAYSDVWFIRKVDERHTLELR